MDDEWRRWWARRSAGRGDVVRVAVEGRAGAREAEDRAGKERTRTRPSGGGNMSKTDRNRGCDEVGGWESVLVGWDSE